MESDWLLALYKRLDVTRKKCNLLFYTCVKLGFSFLWKNIHWGYLRIKCWWENLDLRDMK